MGAVPSTCAVFRHIDEVTVAGPTIASDSAVIHIKADVLFAYGSSAVEKKYAPAIDQVTDFIAANTRGQFLVWGFTGTCGRAADNYWLFKQRATAVANYLIFRGVRPEQLITNGFGENDLAFPTPNETIDARNDRVVRMKR